MLRRPAQLRELRTLLRLSAKAFGEPFEYSEDSIYQMEKGKQGISPEFADAVLGKYGADLLDEAMRRSGSGADLPIESSNPHYVDGVIARRPPLPPDLVLVEFLNQEVEGGDGAAEVADEGPLRHLAFSRSWLIGASPTQSTASVKAVRVRRDSMAPDIRHGDVILVDLAYRRPEDRVVYVIRRSTGLVVKELRRDGSKWMAASRNVDDRQKPFQVKLDEEGGDVIAGRVFWRCGKT